MNLPDGHVAVTAFPGTETGPLRIALVVRRQADPVSGHLVVLRDLADARVLLACVLDAHNQVHKWLEFWVQHPERLTGSLLACRRALSNAVLDDRWRQLGSALEALEGGAILRTGWEDVPPPPLFLDAATLETFHPVEPSSGRGLELCRDEAVLASNGLPGYSASLHRYLWVPSLKDKSPLVPATAGAPENDRTMPLEKVIGDHASWAPINAAAGLVLVRPHAPMEFDVFADLLGGAAWETLMGGREAVGLGPVAEALQGQAAASCGRLFLGRLGREGRLVESLHLKLRLLADAFDAIRAVVRQHHRPLLNVTPASFRVDLGAPGSGLPFLWTAKATLVDPGDAVVFPVEDTDAEYFVLPYEAAMSVYRPEPAGGVVQGRGSVMIWEVLGEPGGPTVARGTLVTQERIRMASRDLIWLRLNLAGRWVDLYAREDTSSALASGEWRFCTIPHHFDEPSAVALKKAMGVRFAEMEFEVIPLLSTPCDLYSMAVLAVRTLLVDAEMSLPMVLDATLSLARQVAIGADTERPLAQRIEALFEQDTRWLDRMGPHHLGREGLAPQEALGLVTPAVWYEVLALIVRLFPGIGPDSECKDWGDAPPGGLHKVFDRTLRDLEGLLVQTRSLIVLDRYSNQEIRGIVGGFLKGLTGEEAASPPRGG